jgi:AcrR family transcriptional regulator
MPRTEIQNKELRETTRQKILHTALVLFAEKGYSSTTIEEIAKVSKISKGLVYNHFESKKHLLNEVIMMLGPALEEMFNKIDTSLPPAKQIQQIISVSFDSIENEIDFWKFYFMMSLQPDIIDEATNYFSIFINEGTTVFEKLMKKCGVKNPKAEAKILGATIDGIGFHFLLSGNNYPLKSVKRKLIEKYSETNICRK